MPRIVSPMQAIGAERWITNDDYPVAALAAGEAVGATYSNRVHYAIPDDTPPEPEKPGG
ncbi:MAG: hypothetical protein V4574_17515 [Pseudomonadota bacterium]